MNNASLKISLGFCSEAGVKVENEDFCSACIPDDDELETKGIAVAIADGMSGCDNGKEASQVSVRMFLDDYYATPDSWTVKQAVNKIISASNRWLYAQGQERYGSAKGLVTTFSALVLKSRTLHLFHVGDSRIYRWREGQLEQLTQDHRVWIGQDREYLSRALGIDLYLHIDYRSLPLQQGDVYVLSTDGVHDFVDDAFITQTLREMHDPKAAAHQLVTHAKHNHSDDNITAQVLRIEHLAEADRDEFLGELTRLPFPPDLEAGHIIDGYKILRELTASSRSQVYLAEDTLNQTQDQARKKVVIKTPSVNFEDDPSYIDLFLHEEWVARRLNSPHLIKTCKRDRKRRFLYTVVEYIHGQSLQQWIHDHPKPSLTQVRGTIEQIARGLRTMHRLEMIHQDLKPDNVLIDQHNTVKIIDFGSAKIGGLAEIQSIVEHSHIVGTANYSAPEYFKGQSGTNQSDIYSLGVIAYEMLTGRLPYGEITPERAAKKRFVYTSARQYNPLVPEWVDAALQKALQPNPNKRYRLLSEFTTDLCKPNPNLSVQKNAPLLERHPVLFWKSLAVFELVILLMFIFFL